MDKNEVVELKPVAAIVETQDDAGNDNTNWKEVAQGLHGVATQYEGLAKRTHTDLGKLRKDPRLAEKKEDKPPVATPAQPVKKEGFDYGELSFLKVSNVPDEDHAYVLGEMQTTGKSLRDILNFQYVKEGLKSKLDERGSDKATPTGSSRSGSSPRSDVEYWMNKGDELPPADQPELRLKVVNARIKREEKGQGQFTTNPIV